MIIYEGIFFENDMANTIYSLEENELAKRYSPLHCTFKFRPNKEEIFNNLVGQEFEITIIGYGCDGNNSGFEILLPPELIKYYINENAKTLITPHVTTSLALNAKAKDTSNLKFQSLKRPIKVIGKFGFYVKVNGREFVSYKPFLL